MTLRLTEQHRRILRLRSELNKIGIPVSGWYVSDGDRQRVQQLVDGDYLRWIDRYFNVEVQMMLDVYLLTPAGLMAIGMPGEAHNPAYQELLARSEIGKQPDPAWPHHYQTGNS